MYLIAAALFAVAAVSATTAGAATIGFDGDKNANPYIESGFVFTPNRIVNGNCLAGGCLALNDNETTTMTLPAAPGLFTLTGLNFNLLGKGTDNTLTITGSNGTALTFPESLYAHNAYHSVLFTTEFQNVSSVTFSTVQGGNVRIDDLSAVAPVPLPAAAYLLLGGLGALGAASRRKRVAA